MNRKRSKAHVVAVVLLMLALSAISCGSDDAGKGGEVGQSPAAASASLVEAQPTAGEQATPQLPAEPAIAPDVSSPTHEATEAAAAEATEPAEIEAPAGGVEATAEPTVEQPTGQVSPTAAASATLDSYRIHTTRRGGGRDGAVKSEWDTEYVAQPFAVHQKGEGEVDMEVVFIGSTLWTRVMDQPWRKVELTEEEAAGWSSLLSPGESPVSVEEQAPLEDSIQWLQGQPQLKIAQDSLTLVGPETVNDIPCRHYTVDSTYPYTVKYQAPLSGSAKVTVVLQGDLWVADQDGWPPFVVRAELLETTTTQVSGGPSSTASEYVEQNVTDVNSPDIVVEPPE